MTDPREMSDRELDAAVAEDVMGKAVVWVKALYAYRPNDGDLDDMIPEYVTIPCEDMGEGVVLYWTAECGTPNEYAPEEIERYSRDPRAFWEMEDKIGEDEALDEAWVRQLCRLVVGTPPSTWEQYRKLIHATPRQRAEAAVLAARSLKEGEDDAARQTHGMAPRTDKDG